MSEAHHLEVVSMKDVRAYELINGWLNLRSHNSLDTQARLPRRSHAASSPARAVHLLSSAELFQQAPRFSPSQASLESSYQGDVVFSRRFCAISGAWLPPA